MYHEFEYREKGKDIAPSEGRFKEDQSKEEEKDIPYTRHLPEIQERYRRVEYTGPTFQVKPEPIGNFSIINKDEIEMDEEEDL